MPKIIAAPKWYPLDVYNKNLSPTEWIPQLHRRIQYKKAVQLYPNKSKIDLFNLIILGDDISDILEALKQTKLEKALKPIEPISVFDVLLLHNKITESIWYKNQGDKIILQEILAALSLGKRLAELNQAQIKVYEKYKSLPWFNYDDVNILKRYPKIPYLSGSPISLNIGFSKESILSEIRKFITKWKGGNKKWELSPEILDSWARKNILAVFDLIEWFKTQSVTPPKTKLAEMIWPNPPESFSSNESEACLKDLFKEGIKLADKVIQEPIISILWHYSKTSQDK
jgi:hypothetical protein